MTGDLALKYDHLKPYETLILDSGGHSSGGLPSLPLPCQSSAHCTALHLACHGGYVALVHRLLAARADPGPRPFQLDVDGAERGGAGAPIATALGCAAAAGQMELGVLLC